MIDNSYTCRFCSKKISAPNGINKNLTCFKPSEMGVCMHLRILIAQNPDAFPQVLQKIWNDGYQNGRNDILTGE